MKVRTTRKPSPVRRANSQMVGWSLTALTCLVLVVGVSFINSVSRDWRRPHHPTVSTIVSTTEPLSSEPEEEPQEQAIILQPIVTAQSPWQSDEQPEAQASETKLR